MIRGWALNRVLPYRAMPLLPTFFGPTQEAVLVQRLMARDELALRHLEELYGLHLLAVVWCAVR